MSTLLTVIKERLAKEGLQVNVVEAPLASTIRRDFPRSKIEFPKIYTVHDYLSEKEQTSSEKEVLLIQKAHEHKIRKIARFFVENPCVTLRNFKAAQRLFKDFYKDKSDFKENSVLLAQEIDKLTDRFHKHGKAHMLSLKDGRLCLERRSYDLGYFKQYFNFNYETEELSVLTVWADRARGAEFLLPRKAKNIKPSEASMSFDAQIWQGFASFGIQKQDFYKVLSCMERNHLAAEDFISLVNAKDLFNLTMPKLITNHSIRTNSRDTTYIEFDTNSLQHAMIKITKNTSLFHISQINK